MSLIVGLEDFKIMAMNIYRVSMFTLNGTICELNLRMCSISIVGVYCIITIPGVFQAS